MNKPFMNIHHIFFDMDGTLFSSENIIGKAFQKGIEQFNIQQDTKIRVPATSEIIQLLGLPIMDIYTNLYPDLSRNQHEMIVKFIDFELLKRIKNHEGHLFPKTQETIYHLKNQGIKLYITSNGRIPYLRCILETFKLQSLFHPLIVIDEKKILTKMDIVLTYAKQYKILPKHTLLVGDRAIDKQVALDFGCPFIGCLYGHNAQEILSSKTTINKIQELQTLLPRQQDS